MVGNRADWARLTSWLREQPADEVTISWAELDAVVGGLPASATDHYPQWWHGDRPNTRAWRRAGFDLQRVNLGRSVAFVRVAAHESAGAAASPAFRGAERTVGPTAPPGRLLSDVDPRRALIVVPCSARKAAGGSPGSSRPGLWPDALYEARRRVAGPAGVDESMLMPAWRRYVGQFYVSAGDALRDAVASGAHLVVLSGGYGLVRAEEPIGTYERVLRRSDWPAGLLGTLIVDEAARTKTQTIVAFAGASTDYARVLRQTSRHGTSVDRALLVTMRTAQVGALLAVPRGLGQAFSAFWRSRPQDYPETLDVEQLW